MSTRNTSSLGVDCAGADHFFYDSKQYLYCWSIHEWIMMSANCFFAPDFPEVAELIFHSCHWAQNIQNVVNCKLQSVFIVKRRANRLISLNFFNAFSELALLRSSSLQSCHEERIKMHFVWYFICIPETSFCGDCCQFQNPCGRFYQLANVFHYNHLFPFNAWLIGFLLCYEV